MISKYGHQWYELDYYQLICKYCKRLKLQNQGGGGKNIKTQNVGKIQFFQRPLSLFALSSFVICKWYYSILFCKYYICTHFHHFGNQLFLCTLIQPIKIILRSLLSLHLWSTKVLMLGDKRSQNPKVYNRRHYHKIFAFHIKIFHVLQI